MKEAQNKTEICMDRYDVLRSTFIISVAVDDALLFIFVLTGTVGAQRANVFGDFSPPTGLNVIFFQIQILILRI